MSYVPHAIEAKWKMRWEDAKVHAAEPGSERPKYYVLDMFPYPSGSGLHVGHASGYVATDVIARRKRMEGFNVLHPMGWDAFGLPAEQFAIQTGQHPRITTDANTANFRQQLKRLGLSYDWDREIDTSDPEYYRWTQWIFLKLYERGLAYRKEVPVWWCDDLKSVLANEEVINGRSERGNHPCERRMVSQWMLRITAYADRLLDDLEGLDWPEGVKKMQRDWIGRSEGCSVRFHVCGSDEVLEVFTTRVDTLFGVAALVLAPEHPHASRLAIDALRDEVSAYIKNASSKSERERKVGLDAISAQATGRYVVHPLLPGTRIPVLVADYVLPEYGTGAVMAVPAHDERDHRLALAAGLDVVRVVVPNMEVVQDEACFTGEGFLVRSPGFDGLDSEKARERIAEALERAGNGRAVVSYRLRDWIFSRQRYWGEPIPLRLDGEGGVHPVELSELPVTLPDVEDFAPSLDGTSPLMRASSWRWPATGNAPALERVTDTMPGWAGSCWYYLRFMDARNQGAPFSRDAVHYWRDVDLYVGGASHAVMHLLYARFWHKVLFDLGLVPTTEPFRRLFNQGMVTSYAFRDATGRLVPVDEVEQVGGTYRRRGTDESLERFGAKMAKSLRNVVNPDDVVARRGCDAFRLYAMFMGPLDSDKPWADDGIPGCEKFLRRVWALLVGGSDTVLLADDDIGDTNIDRILHRCLDRVDQAFDGFNFNTAVAAMMEALNDLARAASRMTRPQAEHFIKMLSPFAPFLAAEVWERLGHASWIDFQSWPVLDRTKLVEDRFELVIQVNGRVRGRCEVPVGTDESEVRRMAHCAVADWLEGNIIGREVYVPEKLYSIAFA